ncbi:MAG: helix-turn-helix domain-containing protein [Pseudomonadota bacterium]|jgi:transcriptional regulator with XRE-family HTH domain
MSDARKWIEDILETPEGARLMERERVLVDATEAIGEVMDRLGMTRTALAEKLDVTPANITQILSGTRNLTLGTLSDVFVALGRSLRIEHEPLRAEIRLHGPIPLSCGWPASDAWPEDALKMRRSTGGSELSA